jgi:hypothetical protein
MAWKRWVEIHDRRARDVMSPKLAAMGVATLSGLILQCLEKTITAAVIMPRKNKQMAMT